MAVVAVAITWAVKFAACLGVSLPPCYGAHAFGWGLVSFSGLRLFVCVFLFGAWCFFWWGQCFFVFPSVSSHLVRLLLFFAQRVLYGLTNAQLKGTQ